MGSSAKRRRSKTKSKKSRRKKSLRRKSKSRVRSPSHRKKSKSKLRSPSHRKRSSYGKAFAVVKFELFDESNQLKYPPQGDEIREWYEKLFAKISPIYNDLNKDAYLLSKQWLSNSELKLTFVTSLKDQSEVDTLLELLTDLDDDGNYPIRGMLVIPKVVSIEYSF
jgi:hypothetical protein